MTDAEQWSSIDARISSLASPDSLPGLAFVKRVFQRIGNPVNFPAIHIAGTNGKGSTAADLDAMLRAQGYKTALYTSPHLVNIGERLMICGTPAAPEKWHDALDLIESVLGEEKDLRLGYFQVTTAACFKIIADENVDAAVIETGLGGRNDATNILPAPLISVITPLGMDHMKLLGNTLPEIAAHKFDIIKENCPALYYGGTPDLNSQFKERCRKVSAEGEVLEENCRVIDVKPSLKGSSFVYCSPCGRKKCFVRLAGLHQPENAALAVRTLELLKDRLPVSDRAVLSGLENVQWPGRMEVVHMNPDVILDGAHNPHGTAALIRSLKALYGADAPLNFVYTSMADKNYMGSLQLYSQAFPRARIYCTELKDFARCEKAERLAAKASALQWGMPPLIVDDPMQAVVQASRSGGPVVICGSLYFIGRMREKVKNYAF